MAIDAAEIESFVVMTAKGVALLFPASAPVIGILTGALSALEQAGVLPHETTAVNVEQVRAQTAGIAAAATSAATEARAPKAAP